MSAIPLGSSLLEAANSVCAGDLGDNATNPFPRESPRTLGGKDDQRNSRRDLVFPLTGRDYVVGVHPLGDNRKRHTPHVLNVNPFKFGVNSRNSRSVFPSMFSLAGK